MGESRPLATSANYAGGKCWREEHQEFNEHHPQLHTELYSSLVRPQIKIKTQNKIKHCTALRHHRDKVIFISTNTKEDTLRGSAKCVIVL